MVIFLEVSGSWNTSIPLASPAPFLSPACSVNWKISELCSALSSNITKQKYLVGLQLMSVLTAHSKAFESSSVWSPTWSSLATFWWVNLGLTFAPSDVLLWLVCSKNWNTQTHSWSHCGTLQEGQGCTRVLGLPPPSITLECMAYNPLSTLPSSSEDERFFLLDLTWVLAIWYHWCFSQGVDAHRIRVIIIIISIISLSVLFFLVSTFVSFSQWSIGIWSSTSYWTMSWCAPPLYPGLLDIDPLHELSPSE